MRSRSVAPSGSPPVLGHQRPRHLWVPEFASSSGVEAIELAAAAGLHLDDWQQFVVHNMLGEREDGKWAAFEVGLEVPRQNGKGGIYEARELAGLFLLGERLLIHSAHEYKTAEQALDRMEAILSGSPSLSRRVRTIKRSHGQEGIYLKSGQVLRYFTRTKSGGRGFSCDFLGLDEAMVIAHAMHAAMFPTMSARPNPQILYAGSAVDQETMDDGLVFARLRARGIAGGDPRLAWFGWSAPFDHPDEVTPEDAADPENWAASNPAFGIRVLDEYIEAEQRALSPRGFAVERLGVGDWPDPDALDPEGISVEALEDTRDPLSKMVDPVCFAWDIRPSRATAAITAAGYTSDGHPLIEVVEHRKGTDWLVERMVELTSTHQCCESVYDKGAAAASVASEMEDRGVQIRGVTTQELGQACGQIFDAFGVRAVRHLAQPELEAAIRGATRRPLGDSAWAWSRRKSTVDICPLVAGTLSLWGLTNLGGISAYEDRGLIVV